MIALCYNMFIWLIDILREFVKYIVHVAKSTPHLAAQSLIR